MSTPRRRRASIAIAAAAAVLSLLIGATALSMALGEGPVSYRDVRDAGTARAFLLQEIELFLPDLDGEVSGVFEFQRVPGSAIVELQKQQQSVDHSWLNNPPDAAVVASWTSTDIQFRVPRPRHGVEALLEGDTFLVVIASDGRTITAVLPHEALSPVRPFASEVTTEILTLRPED